MPDLLIRDLDPNTKAALSAQATRNGRTLSAEIRTILDGVAVVDPHRSALDVMNAGFPEEHRLTSEEMKIFDEAVATVDQVPQTPRFP